MYIHRVGIHVQGNVDYGFRVKEKGGREISSLVMGVFSELDGGAVSLEAGTVSRCRSESGDR